MAIVGTQVKAVREAFFHRPPHADVLRPGELARGAGQRHVQAPGSDRVEEAGRTEAVREADLESSRIDAREEARLRAAVHEDAHIEAMRQARLAQIRAEERQARLGAKIPASEEARQSDAVHGVEWTARSGPTTTRMARPRVQSRSTATGSQRLTRTQAIMQIVVSLFAMSAGIFFVATGDKETASVAGGWIGVVIGYWLR